MQNHFRALRCERGVALPLAMIGLVVVSILVTAALVSSSTDLAISSAQQDATRGVYNAEEALETAVSRIDVALRADSFTAPSAAMVPSPFDLSSGGTGTYTIRQLYRRNPVTAADGTRTDGRAVYCITAAPVRSGGRSSRTLGAFLQLELAPDQLNLNIKGAGSFGGTVEVKGSASIIGQAQDVDKCGTAGAVPAIETSKEGQVLKSGNGVDLVGGSRQTDETKAQFQARILGGKTPLQVARQAHIKFGPLLTSARTFPSSFKALSTVPKDSIANWGCPRSLGVTCTASSADTSYYPTIGIDAQGGQVDLQGDHGQGVLVVVNGGLKISGNFKFKGIILVEGALDVTGSVKVVGAVVGLNTVTVNKVNGNNDLSGTMDIIFDPCVNRRAQQAFNDANPRFLLTRPPQGWFEVVR
jgi:hypothetical protein